jgi:hypothetical protein
MQTFLPYTDFVDTARCLDWRRLGKQRVEAMQILNILTGKTNKPGWRNHPAVLMWKGHEAALAQYMNIMIIEWVRRGYKNTMQKVDLGNAYPPPWSLDEKFLSSHRSNLLRKDPVYYGKFGWTEPLDLEYVWPVKK